MGNQSVSSNKQSLSYKDKFLSQETYGQQSQQSDQDQAANQTTKCYTFNEQDIDSVYRNQINNISKQLKSINEEINQQITQQHEKSFIDQIQIQELSYIINQIYSVKESIQDFKYIRVIEKEYEQLEKDCISIFNSYKEILDDHKVKSLNIIFKKLQILVSFLNLDKREGNIFLKENSGIDLIEKFDGYIQFQIEQIKNQKMSLDFNLHSERYITEKLEKYHESEQFLCNVRGLLNNQIQSYYQQVIEQNKKYDFLQIEQMVNHSQLNLNQLITDQLNQVRQDLAMFSKFISERFKDQYKFNIESMQGLKENSVEQQNIILDILLNLQNVTQKTKQKLFKENLYSKAQKIITQQLENNLKCIGDNIKDHGQENIQKYQEDLQKFKDSLQNIKRHIPNSLFEDIIKEEFNIVGQFQQFEEKVATLLKENKFGQVNRMLSFDCSETQIKYTYELVNQKCNAAINAIRIEMQKFNLDPSLTAQEQILTNLQLFNDALDYFERSIDQVKQEIETQVIEHYQALLVKIFKSFRNINTIQKSKFLHRILDQFLYGQMRIQNVFKINDFNHFFQNQILDFYKFIIDEVKFKYNKYDNIFVLLSLIREIKYMVLELNLQTLLNNLEINTTYQELEFNFLEYSQKQIRRYIYSLNSIQSEFIKSYYDKQMDQIWEFFEINEQDQKSIRQQFIQNMNSEINQIKQTFEQRDFNQIVKISQEYNCNQFISQLIMEELELIKSEILTKFLPFDEFLSIYNKLEILAGYSIRYKEDSQIISKQANSIYKEIKEEMVKIVLSIEATTFKNTDVLQTAIIIIVRIIKIFESKILDIQNQQFHTIQTMSDFLSDQINEIEKSIQSLNSKSLLIALEQINSINNAYTKFKNENYNYLNLFEYIIENTNNLKDIFEYEQIIQPFKNISQFIVDKIVLKQKDLLKEQQILQNENKTPEAIQLQIAFSSFYSEIEKDKSINLNGVEREFFFKLISQEYDGIRKQYLEIKEDFPDPHSLLLFYLSLKNLKQHYSNYILEIQKCKLSQEIKQKIESILNSLLIENKQLITQFDQDHKFIQEFCQNLGNIHKISKKFPGYELQVRSHLIQVINFQQQIFFLINFLFKLNQKAISLNDFDIIEEIQYQLGLSLIGQEIKAQNKQLFIDWEQEDIEKKAQMFNSWEYILQNLKCSQKKALSLRDLQGQCNFFENEYNTIIQQIVQGYFNKNILTKIILDLAKQFKSENNYLQNKKIQWSSEQKTQILMILVYLSVTWMLLDKNPNNSNSEGKRRPSKKVNPAQILAIMRLINIDQSQSSKIQNQVVQIKTGEGKLIAVGITSTIYALLGFQVDCCCYSQSLSESNNNDFKHIYIHFGVESQIQYTTIGQIAEKIINNPNDLRIQGRLFLSQNPQHIPKDQPNKETNKILIVDDFDFLFGENFFGEVYSVGFQYSNLEIINLFKLIWKKKYRHFSIKDVKKSQEYQQLFQQHPYLQSLEKQINTKIKQMLIESRQMENHSYVIRYNQNQIEKAIGYQELDYIDYNTSKGFKTGFAYLFEWQRKKISTELMEKNLYLTFSLGCFSYLKMLNSYNIILGVTGLLDNMTGFQMKQMREMCKIKKLTYIPSIFRESKLKFDKCKDTYIIPKQDDYFQKIYQEIIKQQQNQRAVLIFFENNRILQQFYSKYMQNYGDNCQVLIESTLNKDCVIARASLSRIITLTTKQFGIGTDFKCLCKRVIKNGGIHCIQTFFSQTETQQIQIQGRIARNGQQGSYCLVIHQQQIKEQFNLNENQLSSMHNNDAYNQLQNIRKLRLKQIVQSLEQKCQESLKCNKLSMKMKSLFDDKKWDQKKFLKTLAKIQDIGQLKDIKLSSSYLLNFSKQGIKCQIEVGVKGNSKENRFILQGDRTKYQNVSVLIGQFCVDPTKWFDKQNLQLLLSKSLKKVGVKIVKVVFNEQEFINEISNFDQVWIISNGFFKNNSNNIEKKFTESVIDHLEKKRGLLLLADNEPYTYHANLILKSIPIGYEGQQPIYMKLTGNDPANNQLKRGVYNNKLQFGEHPLTVGLNVLYEGSTICYPKIINDKNEDSQDDFYDIDIIGTSEKLRPCIFALNGNNYRGRIAFDCGFTKMHEDNWDKSPGTEIYFQNCYQWLCNLDNQDY